MIDRVDIIVRKPNTSLSDNNGPSMVTMDFPDRIKTSFGLTGKLIGVSLYPINLNLISTFYSRTIYYLMLWHLVPFTFTMIKSLMPVIKIKRIRKLYIQCILKNGTQALVKLLVILL